MIIRLAAIVIILWGGFSLLVMQAEYPDIIPNRADQISAAVSQALQAPEPVTPGLCPDNDQIGLYGAPCTLSDHILDDLNP